MSADDQDGPARLVRLGRVIASEVLAGVGCRSAVDQALGPATAWRGAPALDRLLFEWICAGGRSDGRAPVLARIRQVDLLGITRWRLESDRMH